MDLPMINDCQAFAHKARGACVITCQCVKMSEILNLALPFFGLILLGVIASRRWQVGEQPSSATAL